MQALFACEAREQNPDTVIDYLFDNFGKHITDRSFGAKLFEGIWKHLKEIQETISTFAPEWPIEKIDPVERVILYIGVYELRFCKDVPKAVVINEAIEIAKQFADENSGKFVNGVLNSVSEEYRKDEKKS